MITRQPKTDYRSGRTYIFKLNAHLVFVTKRRRAVLTDAALIALESIFRDVCGKLAATLNILWRARPRALAG
jgi:REP element-mobilizing transposase RayT